MKRIKKLEPFPSSPFCHWQLKKIPVELLFNLYVALTGVHVSGTGG
ncbi:hypothetical protein ACFY5J_01170 [Peribacillus butanolivorans]|nr:hypothetical protein [Peribacillus butanolivorans]